MVFSSIFFLLYFLPVFLIIYHIIPHKYRNWWILISSILFYSWGAPKFVFVVVASVIIDYYIINEMHKMNNDKNRKWMLALSISINIGLLLFFKYANFFVENVNSVLQGIGFEQVGWTSIALPIGISFYTFQTLTYSIDVYRKVHKPLKSPFQYLVYIMLFPQMIAGPIVRFNQIAEQIEDRKNLETIDNKLLGFFRFAIGLAKKVLIANVMGAEADRIFALSEGNLGFYQAWLGVLAYTFQIYYDFSGYSDMAIGLGRIMGFKFPENFNNPYISQSISEFWRRWHITLGSWMRDYLYIPLGGSRVKSKRRLFFNLWLIFIISGLWHGAAWNFIIWGAYHGIFLIFDRLFWLKIVDKIGKYPSIFITFFITIIGWVLFRAESLFQIKYYLKAMFSFKTIEFDFYITNEFWTLFIIAFIFAFITISKLGLKIENFVFFKKKYSIGQTLFMSFIVFLLLILSIANIVSSDFNPFIYFRF